MMKNDTSSHNNRENSKIISIEVLAQNGFVEELSDREAENLNGGRLVWACGARLPQEWIPYVCARQ